MNLVRAVMLSASGVIVATVAFLNRDRPDWQRGMPWIMGLAVMQVVLGVVSGLVIR